ncbi:acyltransferase family protein [Pseudarthrobacter sp. NPDC058196]|uniref:acyltransferase family protein n=1 Tax=Pseudarthrobacter sp. NPDC058196 TaxID=3346376 RepID=UPI0036D9D265
MTTGGQPRTRLDRLTSLRFFAALAVFCFHATAFFTGPVRDILDFLFGQGRSGVTFFFILSGFVLAWSSRVDDHPLSFYRRRFARIYPAYLVALLFAAVLWLLRDPLALLRGPLAPFLLQAWVPDSNSYFAINVPAWSLSVEAFFYLAFPLVVKVIRPLAASGLWIVSGAAILVTSTVAFVASLTTSASQLDANTFAVWFAIYFPLARLPEFVLGVALALLMKRGALPRISWYFSVSFFLAVWCCMSIWPTIYNVAAVCMVPFGALIVSAAQRDIEGKPGLLRMPLLVSGGAISYCFYLLHHIFILRLSQRGFAELGLTGWGAFTVTLLLSITGAWLLHRYVELPMDNMLGRQRKSLSRSPTDDQKARRSRG